MGRITSVQGEMEPPEKRALIRRAVFQAVLFPFLFGVVLFLPAETLAWPSAWAMLAVYTGGMLLTNLWLIARRPGLAKERLVIPRNAERWDLRLISVVNFLLLGVMLPLAGLDHRLGGSPPLPPAISLFALLSFAASFLFLAGLMAINEFFSSAVRLQSERGQIPVRRGPYRVIRHPGYLAMILQFLSIPVALGSLWALLPALAAGAVYVFRTIREDRFLLDNLPGYAEYAGIVTRRLIPGIW
jgi:protein-S-isoprenylcysteine O-methyltransferase Ste14